MEGGGEDGEEEETAPRIVLKFSGPSSPSLPSLSSHLNLVSLDVGPNATEYRLTHLPRIARLAPRQRQNVDLPAATRLWPPAPSSSPHPTDHCSLLRPISITLKACDPLVQPREVLLTHAGLRTAAWIDAMPGSNATACIDEHVRGSGLADWTVELGSWSRVEPESRWPTLPGAFERAEPEEGGMGCYAAADGEGLLCGSGHGVMGSARA